MSRVCTADATLQATRLLDAAQSEGRELTDLEHERFEEHRETADQIGHRLKDLADRDAAAARVAAIPSLNFGSDDRHRDEDPRAANREERAAVQRVEAMTWAPSEAREAIVNLVEQDKDPNNRMAKWAFVTSSRDYSTAFSKCMVDPETGYQDFTPQEREAWSQAKGLQRAMNEGTNTAGRFLVPAHLDPAIYATNDGAASPIPALSRQITIATKTYTGVTSDGVTASWDAENAAVSDDSPTLGSVSIPTYKGAAWIAASIEVIEDSNIAAEVVGLFADARDRLEAAAFNTGNGTTEPTGIWTTLHANTNVQLVSTTAATIGVVDLQGAFRATPVRWRPKASWLMNPIWAHAIQNLGTALSASYSANLTELPDRLLSKPLYTDDYAPALTTTTSQDSRLIFGDFSAYYIIRRVGMMVEHVPFVMDTSTGRPLGQRGWYAHFRTGADTVSDLAFTELVDRTSA